MMTDRGKIKNTIYRTLPRGVTRIASVFALLILLVSCGGGGEGTQPPLTPAASLKGLVVFTNNVPLGIPPYSGGNPPNGIRYGARIVDPGDDIGSVPLPKPSTLTETGNFEFASLEPDPLVYFNLLFTVNDDLTGNGVNQVPVSFNIPVSLEKAVTSLLSVTIDRPDKTSLQMTYKYEGPDGVREVRLHLDFSTHLLTFDLDFDGRFDDLITVDLDHDAIPDDLAGILKDFDYRSAIELITPVTAIGTSSITAQEGQYEISAITNIYDSVTGNPVALSEINVGSIVKIHWVSWNGKKLSVIIELLPNPVNPQLIFKVYREGLIQSIDEVSIFVGGTNFQDYRQAQIVNFLGQPFPADNLKVGDYVTVDGKREGLKISANKIVVIEQSAPPQYFEREGIIEYLNPPDDPTSMILGGMTFQLPSEIVVRDIKGQILNKSFLVVGNPAWVYAHQNGNVFVADIVELRYEVEEPDGGNVEVVILVDDPGVVPTIKGIINEMNPSTPVAVETFVSDPMAPGLPECMDSVFDNYYWAIGLLKYQPGFIEAFPRVVDGNCQVLILVEYGYPNITKYIDWFFSDGIGGAPLRYDVRAEPPFYGLGPDFNEAQALADKLAQLVPPDLFAFIYVSPGRDFTSD